MKKTKEKGTVRECVIASIIFILLMIDWESIIFG